MLLTRNELRQGSSMGGLFGFGMFAAVVLGVSFNNSRGVLAACFGLSFLCEIVSCLGALV